MEFDHLNRTGCEHFENAPSRKYYLNQIKPLASGAGMNLTDSYKRSISTPCNDSPNGNRQL